MIEFIKYDNVDRWNQIVESFEKCDVYYRCEYAQSFMLNEHGIPYLIYFWHKNFRLCMPVVEKDISEFEAFIGLIPKDKYMDWNTPYGYGGPVSNYEKLPLDVQQLFMDELTELALRRNVVSLFVRFHSMLENHRVCENVITFKSIKEVIFMDLATQDDPIVQMNVKCRNLVRKAEKNGVTISHDAGNHIDEFMKLYKDTMDRDQAEEFYYFPREYYTFLNEKMCNETEFFYAHKDGKMIAASIFFYDSNQMHYHLSCSDSEFRSVAPTNLLLYEAAKWGQKNGIKTLLLGGGVEAEDGLFHFKKQFNRNGKIGYYIGGNIFDDDRWNELLDIRVASDPMFDRDNVFFIKYRK